MWKATSQFPDEASSECEAGECQWPKPGRYTYADGRVVEEPSICILDGFCWAREIRLLASARERGLRPS